MSDYPKHDAALASALKDLGVHEQPPGSNTGPRILTYQHATWLAGTGWPWCIAFLQYQWKQGGLAIPYLGAGAYALLEWAKTQPGWYLSPAQAHQALPGDGVIFNLGAGHGAMLKQPVSGGTVLTVDGNVSDKVCLNERALSTVRGFVHVPETPVVPVPVAKPGPFEVVTSISGHKLVIFNGKASTIGQKLPRFLQLHPSVTVRRRKKP